MLDDAELEGAFNEKTKAIILNTPNNPLGKVFNRYVSRDSLSTAKSSQFSVHCRRELTKIADLCKRYNVLCISDEVYEWMIYDDNQHVRICMKIEPIPSGTSA